MAVVYASKRRNLQGCKSRSSPADRRTWRGHRRLRRSAVILGPGRGRGSSSSDSTVYTLFCGLLVDKHKLCSRNTYAWLGTVHRRALVLIRHSSGGVAAIRRPRRRASPSVGVVMVAAGSWGHGNRYNRTSPRGHCDEVWRRRNNCAMSFKRVSAGSSSRHLVMPSPSSCLVTRHSVQVLLANPSVFAYHHAWWRNCSPRIGPHPRLKHAHGILAIWIL